MFIFVIAYEFSQKKRLSTFMIGHEVFHTDNAEEALELLDYVKRRSPEHDWHIYKIEGIPYA